MKKQDKELRKNVGELVKVSGKVLYHIFVIIGLVAFLVVLIAKFIMKGGI